MFRKFVRPLVFALIVVSFLMTSCSAAVPATSTPTSPSVAVSTSTPTDPYGIAYWDTWKTYVQGELAHIYQPNQIPFVEYATTDKAKCSAYAAWDYLVPSPSLLCKDSPFVLSFINTKGDTGLLGLDIVPVRQLPEIEELPYYDGDVTLDSCDPVYDTTFSDYVAESIVNVDVNGNQVEFHMPSLAIITYEGKKYKLPRQCMTDEADKLSWQYSIWTTSQVPLISAKGLEQKFGRVFHAAIVDQFLADPSILIKVKGESYLIKDSNFAVRGDGVYWPNGLEPAHTSFGMGWIAIEPTADGMNTICFNDSDFPEGITDWIDPAVLQGTQAKGTILYLCLKRLVILSDGRAFFVQYVTDIHDNNVYDEFSDYLYYENDHLWILDHARDPHKDALAVSYARQISPEVTSPIEACRILKNNWSDTQFSASTVEWLCGKMSFRYRFATGMDEPYQVYQLGPWLIGTAHVPPGIPQNLTYGSTQAINRWTTIQVARKDEMSECGYAQVWVSIFDRGEWSRQEYCVHSDEYLFVLPLNTIDFDNGEYHLPPDPIVYRFIINN